MDPRPKYSIHEAAREGKKASVVESLLNENPRLASRRDDDDRLPIHWAVSYNHPDIVDLLMTNENFDPDVQDGSGWTPLMMAASLPETPLVDTLLRKSADVNLRSKVIKPHASEIGIIPLTTYLRPDFNGQTAIHFCVSKSNLEVARKLVEHKASVRVKDRRGQLPIHRAAAVGSVPLIHLLLENRSPLNATDSSGQSALHHAISEGHGDAALVLLKAGAETDRRDVDGHLALELAPDSRVRDFVVQSAVREGVDLD